MNDTQMLDWLEYLVQEGYCPGLINDDDGRWALSLEGIQDIPMGGGPQDVYTSFFVEAKDWKPTIREAILSAHKEFETDRGA